MLQYVDNDVYVDDVVDDGAGAGSTFCTAKAKAKPFCTVDHWMDHSQSAVSRTSLSTAC